MVDPTVPSAPPDTYSSRSVRTSAGNEPVASIAGWSFNNELESRVVPQDKQVVLDPRQPEIILFFNPAPTRERPIEFRYRLSDYDLNWTVTRAQLAHYRRLNPGHYRFEVQAHTPNQPWSTPPAVFSVYQRPSFYQTWYFYVILVLSAVALAIQLLQQHDRLLKGQMGILLEERSRIASDCHDTLMAGFAAISWQLEATAKLFRDSGETESAAARSCELARSMVAHCQAEARRIIWDLRDSEEVTNVLSHALSRAISAHRLRDTVETTFEVEGDETPLPPSAVHHLVCIGQEAVTNAIRHSHSSKIHIRVRYDADSLSLSIRDNGCGFLPSDSTTRAGHFGIPVMEERARKLGGTLRFNTSMGVGTEVAVSVRFQTISEPVKQQHHIVRWIGV
jgi:signal transduction histidine kinase